MAGIYSQGGSAGHRYAGWLSEVEAKNFQFGGKVFNGSPSAIYVGSNLVWLGLTEAAEQAIRGAFGQRDGWAVIKATNAYLNQLAASGQAGKDKATALAGFINEDPMMVCSLGLEPQGVTMPIRLMDNNGTAYINTGVALATGLDIEFRVFNNQSNRKSVFGPSSQGWLYSFMVAESYWRYYPNDQGRWAVEISNVPAAGMTDVHIEASSMTMNGYGSTFQADAGATASGTFCFLNGYGGVPTACGGFIKIANEREMYPLIRNGVYGMIDVVHKVFYQNAGSGNFTEVFKIYQNGSWVTWTPSTP